MGIAERVAALATEPALAGRLGADAAWLVWNSDATRLLAWSDAGAPFRRAVADRDGVVDPALPFLSRLQKLAKDPVLGGTSRIERLRVGLDGFHHVTGLACRRLALDEGEGLLTVFIAAGTEAAPAEADGRGDGQEDAPAIARIRRQGRRRFIWSMDRDGRFTSVSRPLAEVVGEGGADIVGRTWDEVARRWIVEPAGTIAERFSRQATWSDETVSWRIEDTAFVVPIELGAMPVFGRDHVFEGFRGFGLCRVEAIRRDAQAGFASVEDRRIQREAYDADAAAALPDLLAASGSDRRAVAAYGALEARVAGQLGAARPLPFRAMEDLSAASATAVEPERPATISDLEQDQSPHLSVAERGALKEIARALGARIERDDAQDGNPARASADILPMPATRMREPEATRILDRLPVGIVVLRAEMPIFANRFALDLLGHADVGELAAEGGISRLFVGRLDRRAKRGVRGPGPLTLLSRAGADLPVEVKLTTVEWGEQPASLLMIAPVRDAPDGEVAALRSAKLDHDRLVRRVRELEAASEMAGSGFATVDPAGRILSLGPVAETMFGYQANEVTGDTVTLLVAPADHRAAIDLLQRSALGTGETLGADLSGLARDGRAFPLRMTCRTVHPDGDEACVVVFRDRSEEIERTGELRAAQRGADLAGSRQDAFLARIGHEIRTPLTAVVGFAEILLDDRLGAVGSERGKLYLRDIRESGLQVVKLLDDLLELSKVAAGQAALSFESLDLTSVVAEGVEAARSGASGGRVVVRTSFASGLAPVVADRRAVRRIAETLVASAIASAGAGGQVIVSTGVAEGGGTALRVRDTGAGLTTEEMEAALAPFGIAPATRQPGPTNFALPLAKVLVEANRGALSLRRARGGGTLAEAVFPAPTGRRLA